MCDKFFTYFINFKYVLLRMNLIIEEKLYVSKLQSQKEKGPTED